MKIRTLKPDCWRDERVAEVSVEARLLWVGLITQADDAGRLARDPRLLRASIFPLDSDDRVEEIAGWTDELIGAGLVIAYGVAGRDYLSLPRWTDHQRIQRVTPSRIPAPPTDEGHDSDSPVLAVLSKLAAHHGVPVPPADKVLACMEGFTAASTETVARDYAYWQEHIAEKPHRHVLRGYRSQLERKGERIVRESALPPSLR